MNSNAAAKARRAGIKPNIPPAPTSTPNNSVASNANSQSSGLTLPQVISVIDKRLVNLESFMKETKENPILMAGNQTEENQDAPGFIVPSEFNTFVNEINDRFQMFADEIETMKNTLLKLQSFTMDVNKALLEKANIVVSDSSEVVFQLSDTSDADQAVTETEDA